MKKKYIFLVFILLLTTLTFYYLYQILSPFLASIIWAILLAIVFYPLFLKLERLLKKKRVLSALAMTLFALLVIVLPVSLLMISLANEVIDFYHHLDEMMKTGQLQASLSQIGEFPLLKWVLERLKPHVDLSQVDPLRFLLKNVQQISTFLFNQTSNLLKGVSTFVAGFFFTLLSLYYLFKDGDHLLKRIKEIVPLPPIESQMTIERFKAMISATLYGGILIAILQGILGGVSFWVLGISSPVFWGTMMAFLSFIPMGGTALIWCPAAIFLLLQGAILKGIILLGLGVLLISMIDNLLRPLLVSTKTNIHPLLLFFSVLGGIQAFGMIGLVGGPLIMTLALTLVEIYIQGIKSSE
ncbi:MAG: AI-2E family transporter [Deltaproteobacteria bacterium]|nr:AI-2E family transporter [Deltaproteobacteria bacterium]MBM4323157.1 AI-2E family transporter [Deltaproteobacteria bacterium]MBM4347793.1 AI-2E family transporter [Deltaproteobacteria bacterium]